MVKQRDLKFSYSSTAEEVKNIWLSRVNTIYGFLQWAKNNSLLKPAQGMSTYIEAIYYIYTRWCEANDKQPEPQAAFTKELKRLGYIVVRERSGKSKLKNHIFDIETAEKNIKTILGEEEPA
jgi:phage/plasmid-associated DNA primase